MLIDLTGQTFNRLTVLERAKNAKDGSARWLCRCECGNEVIVSAANLKSGATKSCGCLRDEKARERSTTHGMYGTSIYKTWKSMKKRCENPNYIGFDNYGGRGIKVCERWHIFENFYADVSQMEHFGEQGYTIDRIDVNGDYEPGNVRWATNTEQARNKHNNIKVVYNGVEMCLTDAAEKSGINYGTLRARYHVGKRGADLFAQVENTNIIVEYQGEQMNLKDAAQKSGIANSTLRYRYHAGKRGEDLFKPVLGTRD